VAFLLGEKDMSGEESMRAGKNMEGEENMFGGKNMTREEVIAAIQDCTEKLGRVPNRIELAKQTGLSRHDVNRYFGNYMLALKECGLEKTGGGMKVGMERLFQDWTRVARVHKKLPTVFEFERESRYSVRPFRRLFGKWSNVAEGMKRYALERGLTNDWQDVMELIDGEAKGQADGQKEAGGRAGARILADRAVYGRLLRPSPLVCAPVNEAGVIFLFGAMAEQMGFQMLRIQAEYPDGEALRTMAENRLQRVKIEFEYESRNFLRHNHDAALCDLIICWEDNWPDSPLEVIELKRAFN
jgi:Homing endonuclease associated repeat